MRLNYKKIIIFFLTLIFMIMVLSENLLCQNDADINLNFFIMGYNSSNTKFTPMSKPTELTIKSYYDSYFTMKGMNFIDYSAEGYWTEESHRCVDRLREDNVNFVAVNVIVYQNEGNSTVIYNDSSFTPSHGPLTNIITHIHSLGMKVFLKVMVDSKDGTSRTEIFPSSTADWFTSYESIITQYARMAQDYEVELFSVGCELKKLSEFYNGNWTTIIDAIKSIYNHANSEIIYCANWDEYKEVSFWDKVDYMGIDAYFPLSELQDPSLDQISDGWSNYTGMYGIHNWVDEITNNRAGKDVIFTEIGYRSADYSAKEPWKEENGVINLDLQDRCYRAAMEVWKPFTWFKGIFWWDWPTKMEGAAGDNHGFEFPYLAWTFETYFENMACTNVKRSEVQKHEGLFSLKMDFDLVWEHANKSSGVAYWDVGDKNLRGKTISTWFLCPDGSQGGTAPNGVSIFVKDTDYIWHEKAGGGWKNITTVGDWFQVKWDLPDEFWTEHIMIVGVKVGTPTGGYGGPENDYAGPIYIDDYIWYDTPPEGDNHGFESEPIDWTYEAIPENKAVINVGQSSEKFTNGSHSLKLDCHLVWQDTDYSKGMAYWNVGNTNLRGKEISTYFYCPDGSQGSSSFHNGVSIFAKDTGDVWHEGAWQNIETTDSWFKFTWILPDENWTENIKIAGVKLGTPTGGGSHAENDYDGAIYIDDFVWTNEAFIPETSYYNWEDGTTMGWYPETYVSDQAFNVPPAPANSTEQANGGTRSLKCHTVLTQGHANYDKGFMWVDCLSTNLTGKTISVYVWVPSEFEGKWNGIQLAFKDSGWTYCDTTWQSITVGNGWVQYTATLPGDIAWNDGINITNVAHMGVKLGCGGGSGFKFDGYIYIDDYTWSD